MRINSLVIVVIGLFLFSLIGQKIVLSILTRKVGRLLLQERYDELDRLLNSRMAKILMDPFNIDYIKLNQAFMKNNEKEIDDCFRRFDQVRLNAKQKSEVCNKAFYYYTAKKDAALSKKYGNYLIGLTEDAKIKADIKKYYQICIEDSYEYLEEYLRKVEANEGEKAKNEFLISRMYQNMGDMAKAKDYLKRSMEDM